MDLPRALILLSVLWVLPHSLQAHEVRPAYLELKQTTGDHHFVHCRPQYHPCRRHARFCACSRAAGGSLHRAEHRFCRGRNRAFTPRATGSDRTCPVADRIYVRITSWAWICRCAQRGRVATASDPARPALLQRRCRAWSTCLCRGRSARFCGCPERADSFSALGMATGALYDRRRGDVLGDRTNRRFLVSDVQCRFKAIRRTLDFASRGRSRYSLPRKALVFGSLSRSSR